MAVELEAAIVHPSGPSGGIEAAEVTLGRSLDRMPVLESPQTIGADSPGLGVGKGAWFRAPYLVHLSLPCCTSACENTGSHGISHLSCVLFDYWPWPMRQQCDFQLIVQFVFLP